MDSVFFHCYYSRLYHHMSFSIVNIFIVKSLGSNQILSCFFYRCTSMMRHILNDSLSAVCIRFSGFCNKLRWLIQVTQFCYIISMRILHLQQMNALFLQTHGIFAKIYFRYLFPFFFCFLTISLFSVFSLFPFFFVFSLFSNLLPFFFNLRRWI